MAEIYAHLKPFAGRIEDGKVGATLILTAVDNEGHNPDATFRGTIVDTHKARVLVALGEVKDSASLAPLTEPGWTVLARPDVNETVYIRKKHALERLRAADTRSRIYTQYLSLRVQAPSASAAAAAAGNDLGLAARDNPLAEHKAGSPAAVGAAALDFRRRVGDLVTGLNESQREALDSAGSQPLTLIQGPPGTGKSQTSAAIVSVFVRDGHKVRHLPSSLSCLY